MSQLRQRPALVIFFLVFAAASVPLLYYYKRKNPHPRFRPSTGEMTLVSILALGLSFGMAMALSSVFDHEHSIRKMNDNAEIGEVTTSEINRDDDKDSEKEQKKDSPPKK